MLTVSTYAGSVDKVNIATIMGYGCDVDETQPAAGGTRALLVEAAASLLAEGGPEAVTLRAVGARTGLSRSAAYRHFADKDELLAGAAAEGFRTLTARLREAHARGRTPRTRLGRMIDAYCAFALAEPAHYDLMLGPAARKDHPEVQEAALEALGMLVEAVADLQAAGDLPPGDPLRHAGLLWATAHGGVQLALVGIAGPAKGLDAPAVLTRRALDLLAAQAGAPSGSVRHVRNK